MLLTNCSCKLTCYAGGHGTLLQKLVLPCSFERHVSRYSWCLSSPIPCSPRSDNAQPQTSLTFLLPGADKNHFSLSLLSWHARLSAGATVTPGLKAKRSARSHTDCLHLPRARSSSCFGTQRQALFLTPDVGSCYTQTAGGGGSCNNGRAFL